MDENVERSRFCELCQRARIVQVDHTGAAARLRGQDCQPFGVTPDRVNLESLFAQTADRRGPDVEDAPVTNAVR